MEIERASYSYNNLLNMVTRSRKMYELLLANGAEVHQFNNRLNTANAAIQLLRLKIEDEKFSNECVEAQVKKSRATVYDFIAYVGKQINYYNIEEVAVSESTR